jgi:cytoskeleton-associated protein 5
LRRVAGPSSPEKAEGPITQASRLATAGARSASPAPSIASRIAGSIPRAASPAGAPTSRLARPVSPSYAPRSLSPAPSSVPHPSSPARTSKLTKPSSHLPPPSSPSGIGRPKSLLPSRLGPPRSLPKLSHNGYAPLAVPEDTIPEDTPYTNGNGRIKHADQEQDTPAEPVDGITVAISSILSNDPSRSVDALKKIQKVLEISPEEGPSSASYRELAEHTEGLIETITLQMAHVFERPDDITANENFRLAKHLIQTLNAFCDHVFLAESLTVDILTSLLEELTLRLLQTDHSPDSRVKDLSRFINMIILRLFNTARRMSVIR